MSAVRELIGIAGYAHIPSYRLRDVAKGHIIIDGNYIAACGKKVDSRMTRSNWTGAICKACEKKVAS